MFQLTLKMNNLLAKTDNKLNLKLGECLLDKGRLEDEKDSNKFSSI